ncbi:homeobox protein engrailed-2-A-like [Choristoneura fumiferana]|uniref:homeobox protein engrailed-2-A-like n=1 Tax=Choristoneura fumiferana TaxID=7141 RepID=UPI003D153CDF
MDVSPVRSSKSGSSDFSIERILSEESSSNREAPSDLPDWLCCTRYRPPRLPRAVSNNVCRSRRAGRHARVPFTAAQAAALEAAYARAPYLAPPALRALAAALQLRDDRIKIWFQNRRARERREKCRTITPPQAVTLAPTRRSVTDTLWTPHSSNELPSFINLDMFRREVQSDNSLEVHCERLSPNEESGSTDDRPESPLDIETIDE